MPEEFPTRFDHKEAERKIYKLWEEGGYFNPNFAETPSGRPDNLPPGKETYAIHLPPPNITGSLHIGHALNATLSDILVRYHRMQGYKTVWFPGIDHAGIATQNVVEKELKKDGKTRRDLGREKFIERVWEWKEKYGGIILGQLKRLGASCDWSRTRFTMDAEYAGWVRKAFIHYYEKKMVYRGKRVVNWCPRCGTSISDLEVEYKEEKTKLWHIKYPIAGGNFIVVATTRPETMLGDAAVAVNPKDARYKKFVGKKTILPIQNREIPIVDDVSIDMKFGTGAVKVTPAHDITDSEIAERHKLPFYEIVDERGRMTETAGEKFKGMKIIEAREAVVKELENLKLIEKIEDYTHNLAVCSRCGTTVEPILSNQWFLKMDRLAKGALKAVADKKIKIIPDNFEKPYVSWLENIKDWCISRQLWWGHRLPVWFHEEKCVSLPDKEKEAERCEEVKVSETEPKCDHCNAGYIQSEDVLDTWFSSALWPFAGLSKKDLKNFYPSNILITDRGIINLWVGRMIFSGLEFMKKEPFPEVLIHATVLTKDGKRMSKSLGTGIDPLLLIEKYGADALRFGIIWQAMGTQDIRWDETAVVAGQKFATKLWNIARFVAAKIGNKAPATGNDEFGSEDRSLLDKLKSTKKIVGEDVANHNFGQALHKIYDFVWHDLADKYLEFSKTRDDEGVKKTLGTVLLESLKMLHPFMPFVTEEIYQKLQTGEGKQKLLAVEKW